MINQKECYQRPVLEIIEFSNNDIITTSGEKDGIIEDNEWDNILSSQ